MYDCLGIHQKSAKIMKNHSILLIDDDEDEALLLQQAVQHVERVSLFVENDPERALSKIRQGEPLHTDIVFIDIHMPAVSGSHILSLLRSHHGYEKLIIVVYSSSSNYNEVLIAKGLGASYFIRKPHTVDELIHILRSLFSLIDGDINTGIEGNAISLYDLSKLPDLE